MQFMSRIPLLPPDTAEPRALVDLIRARRGGSLRTLDRVLLHSIPLAQAWNDYLRVIRGELSIPAQQRELAICTVAAANADRYEFIAHSQEFVRSGGHPGVVDGLGDPEAALERGDLFSPAESAVVRLALELTQHIAVKDTTWA